MGNFMGIRKDFSVALAKKELKQAEAARILGVSPQVLNRKLVNGSMKYDEALAYAEKLGFEIIWIEKEKK